MHGPERRVPPAVSGETLDYIESTYALLGVEAALASYLDRGVEGTEVDGLLAEYSAILADSAVGPLGVNVAALQFGVDHLTASMNEVCSRKHGYEPPKTLREAVLVKTGRAKPTPIRWISGLDDRYWIKQFPDEYRGEKLVARHPDETDQQYLARHLNRAIQGLIFSRFTYM